MEKPALVIIDMQPQEFESARDRKTTEAILCYVEESIKREEPIIIVEYVGCGPTADSIIDAVSDYDEAYFVTKHGADGAGELRDTIFAKNLKVSEFLICGVNLSCCIRETVEGLYDRICSNITILKDACYCFTILEKIRPDKDNILNHYSIFKNCNIIG